MAGQMVATNIEEAMQSHGLTFNCILTGERLKPAKHRMKVNVRSLNINQLWKLHPILADAAYARTVNQYTDMEIQYCNNDTGHPTGQREHYRRAAMSDNWDLVE